PDDIGVVLLDKNKRSYQLADALEVLMPRDIGWTVNKGYESKQKMVGQVLITNTNNVKGLEFPFVICVTSKITSGYGYRNSLYMTLTRSFLKTYLLTSMDQNAGLLPSLHRGLGKINTLGRIEVSEPSMPERNQIKTTIRYTKNSESFYDFVSRIFDEMHVLPIFRPPLMDIVKSVTGEDFDYNNVKEVAEWNYARMREGRDDA
ncbi:ATP-binding domain-containing protein, partial [Xanthomonas translucens]|uniref:ATP-binding domain-containing protein n=3 Tax=Xanthomonas campestris pv. translucens TaxID=343 RepID=UPI001E2E45A1